jgi:hypothetical protein
MTSRTESTPKGAPCSSTTRWRMRRSCISAAATFTSQPGETGHHRGGHVIGDPRPANVAEPRGDVHHVALGEDAGELTILLHHHRADAMLLHDLGSW